MLPYAMALVPQLHTFLALPGTCVMLKKKVNICGYYRHDHLNLRRVGANLTHQIVGSF